MAASMIYEELFINLFLLSLQFLYVVEILGNLAFGMGQP